MDEFSNSTEKILRRDSCFLLVRKKYDHDDDKKDDNRMVWLNGSGVCKTGGGSVCGRRFLFLFFMWECIAAI